ncbi:MAG: Multidrug resistance protein MdtA [Chlamydiia bacterium]|nr:Multidrug resistance protein MdtA [Chlamydiia bacterium]MCH9615905.1 Multidrug resistance protein MdtA [Chlamydiia bacterium]MCH9628692.1 Multidrug resistance protein MdtA [Chlamydiia bacterium]
MKQLLIIAILALSVSCTKKKTTHTPPPPKVKITKVVKKDIALYLDGIGHVRAYNTAAIKAQVEGVLLGVHYEQGQEAKEGELLLTIDPRPYQAALDQAEANLQETIANLRFAKDRAERYEPLVGNNYVSQLNFDEYVSKVAFYDANALANEAEIDTAKINLSYCYVRAPFTGRVGKRLVDEGNLIANDGTPLITMTQTKPIYVDFALSERDFYKIKEGQTVEVVVPEKKGHVDAELIVVDNMVNQNTGMIGLRAVSPNKNEELWPGQFIRAKLKYGEAKGALLIPTDAILAGQNNGRFVYIMSEGNTVVYRRIELGEKIGEMYQVLKGIEEHDSVVTNGQINLKPHDKVQVIK